MSDGITDAARGYHCKPDWRARALHAEAVAEELAKMYADSQGDIGMYNILDKVRRVVRQRGRAIADWTKSETEAREQ